jgi:hypothetical protein
VARGADPTRVASLAVAYARRPRPKEEVIAHLRTRLGDVFEERFSWLLWRYVSAHADLVSAPPGGHWGYSGTDAPYVAARHWIGAGRRPAETAALEHLIRRFLGAFGPATMADICKFAGQVPARVRPVLDRVAPGLRRFMDEQGRTLFDLPRAPRPNADVVAPVRFLPRYDEVLIAYQHRDRVIAPPHRPAIYAKNGIIEATVLVDGMVAGTWTQDRGKTDLLVRVRPFGRLTRSDRAAVLTEAERLARFLAPEASTHGARIG